MPMISKENNYIKHKQISHHHVSSVYSSTSSLRGIERTWQHNNAIIDVWSIIFNMRSWIFKQSRSLKFNDWNALLKICALRNLQRHWITAVGRRGEKPLANRTMCNVKSIWHRCRLFEHCKWQGKNVGFKARFGSFCKWDNLKPCSFYSLCLVNLAFQQWVLTLSITVMFNLFWPFTKGMIFISLKQW